MDRSGWRIELLSCMGKSREVARSQERKEWKPYYLWERSVSRMREREPWLPLFGGFMAYALYEYLPRDAPSFVPLLCPSRSARD